MADDTSAASVGRHRPKSTTVFVAAFVAGAVAAVVVNRALDLHLAQSKPQVESEPIFVALRAMPQGSPVTVWDVALRDWPRAMLPTSALRAGDTFEGSVLKYPVREGQPLLAVQLMPAEQPVSAPPAAVEEAFVLPPQAAPAEQVASVPPASRTVEPPKPQETEVVAVPPARAEESPAGATEAAGVEAANVDTATSEPEQTPAAERKPFDLEPTEEPSNSTTAKTEPESGTPTPAVTESQPTPVASDVDPLLDTPARPAVDLEKIPSVMARSDESAEPAEVTASTGPVRYLVVPERIARQADTSFVPPPAVEPTPESAPAPMQPVATKPTQSAQTSTPPVKGFPQRSGAQKTASRPMPKQPQARGQQQGSQSQRKPQPQATTKQQRQQTANPAADRERTEAASKPREPMFPILAAGIEAIGSRWRNGDEEATATDQSGAQRRK
jgi:hypothetical protein